MATRSAGSGIGALGGGLAVAGTAALVAAGLYFAGVIGPQSDAADDAAKSQQTPTSAPTIETTQIPTQPAAVPTQDPTPEPATQQAEPDTQVDPLGTDTETQDTAAIDPDPGQNDQLAALTPDDTAAIDPVAPAASTAAQSPEKTEPIPEPTAETLAAPAFDVVRVAADGATVIAGTGPLGGLVSIFLDDVIQDAQTVDGSGKFVSFLFLDPSKKARLLTLKAERDGAQVWSDDQIILAPSVQPEPTPVEKPPVIAQAQVIAEPVVVEEAVEVEDSQPTKPEVEQVAQTDQVAQAEPEAAQTIAQAEPEVLPEAEQPDQSIAEPTDLARQRPQARPEPAKDSVIAALENTAPTEDAPPQTELDSGETGADPVTSQNEPAPSEPAVSEPVTDMVVAKDQSATDVEIATADPVPAAVKPAPSPKPAEQSEPAESPEPATQLALVVPPTSPEQPDIIEEAGPDTAQQTSQPTPPAAIPVTVLRATSDGVEVLQTAPAAVPSVMDRIALDLISYSEQGEIQLSGRAQGGSVVRVYLNNTAIAELLADDEGRWRGVLKGVKPGVYTLRLDEVDAMGAVVSRLETPFKREAPEALLAAQADQPPDAQLVGAVTVQTGDTLWAISRARYGEGVLYVRLFEANRDSIVDPDLIYPGQVFAIPD